MLTFDLIRITVFSLFTQKHRCLHILISQFPLFCLQNVKEGGEDCEIWAKNQTKTAHYHKFPFFK